MTAAIEPLGVYQTTYANTILYKDRYCVSGSGIAKWFKDPAQMLILISYFWVKYNFFINGFGFLRNFSNKNLNIHAFRIFDPKISGIISKIYGSRLQDLSRIRFIDKLIISWSKNRLWLGLYVWRSLYCLVWRKNELSGQIYGLSVVSK